MFLILNFIKVTIFIQELFQNAFNKLFRRKLLIYIKNPQLIYILNNLAVKLCQNLKDHYFQIKI